MSTLCNNNNIAASLKASFYVYKSEQLQLQTILISIIFYKLVHGI